MTADALDIEQPDQLLCYLRRTGRIGADEAPPAMTVLRGGVSNRTVLVERAGGEAWVLKQALAKLRTAADWFSDPSRSQREALGIRRLSELAPPDSIPPLVFEDRQQHLLAMQAVPRPHENFKSMLMAGQFEEDHFRQFGTLIAAIHRAAADRADTLSKEFDDRSFFESLRLEPYYLYTAERVPEAAAYLRKLVDDTRARRMTLVHGDYSPKNILVRDGRLILLDHEVVHWGDPAFDLGFALAHILSKARHLPQHRERLAEATVTFLTGYISVAGDAPFLPELEWFMIQHTLGCLLARVAGRSQLEYLSDDEKARQRQVVLTAMADLPFTFRDLVDRIAAPDET